MDILYTEDEFSRASFSMLDTGIEGVLVSGEGLLCVWEVDRLTMSSGCCGASPVLVLSDDLAGCRLCLLTDVSTWGDVLRVLIGCMF